MKPLTPESELADALGLTPKRAAELRCAHRWPHVRLGRFNVRYTDEQIAAIVAMETVKPKATPSAGVAGQTTRSARRSA